MEDRLYNLSKEELIVCIKKQAQMIEKLTNEVLPKNYDLESRIKKAIEYIEENMKEEYIHTDYIYEMIKILRGKDNDN